MKNIISFVYETRSRNSTKKPKTNGKEKKWVKCPLLARFAQGSWIRDHPKHLFSQQLSKFHMPPWLDHPIGPDLSPSPPQLRRNAFSQSHQTNCRVLRCVAF